MSMTCVVNLAYQRGKQPITVGHKNYAHQARNSFIFAGEPFGRWHIFSLYNFMQMNVCKLTKLRKFENHVIFSKLRFLGKLRVIPPPKRKFLASVLVKRRPLLINISPQTKHLYGYSPKYFTNVNTLMFFDRYVQLTPSLTPGSHHPYYIWPQVYSREYKLFLPMPPFF